MRITVLCFGLCCLVMAVVSFGKGWRNPSSGSIEDKSALIKFSHQKHISEFGVECVTCHAEATTSRSSTDKMVPGHTVCQTCHEEQVSKVCGYCHVDEKHPAAFAREERDIHFSHKKHAGDEKIECARCHAGLEKVDYATRSNMPVMATCTTCHDNVKAGSQCESCHINLATLRPTSHKEGNFVKDHPRFARLNVMDSQCAACHTENYCAQCHDGSNLTALSRTEKSGLISPRVIGNDKSQALKGQAVHDMNYRFTHGIDAQGRAADCQVCHKAQTFCNDCHASGSQALGGTVPASHELAGFVTIGVGTGGGQHAKLAQRDIQSCMSCHDTEGNDPTCVKCHNDPDGVKGTNPRTHTSQFMSGVEGDWHTEPGATCFACHTDPNAKPKRLGGISGRGFCGYCHGKK